MHSGLILTTFLTVKFCGFCAVFPPAVHDLKAGFTWIPVPLKSKGPRYNSQPNELQSELDFASSHNHVHGLRGDGAYSYAPSGFDSGYGMVQNSVGFSALGFLGFLFFLKLIQDTLTLVNGGNGRSERFFAKRSIIKSDPPLTDQLIRFYLAFLTEEDISCRRKMTCAMRASLVEHYEHFGRMMSLIIIDILMPVLDGNVHFPKPFQITDNTCKAYAEKCAENGSSRQPIY